MEVSAITSYTCGVQVLYPKALKRAKKAKMFTLQGAVTAPKGPKYPNIRVSIFGIVVMVLGTYLVFGCLDH